MEILEAIEFSDFTKVEMRVGTITHAEANSKARLPAYILTIDFGELGVKTSSAQITQHYQCSELVNQQVIAVMNFPAKRVAGVKSEVLVLAAVDEQKGTILIQPNKNAVNGSRIL